MGKTMFLRAWDRKRTTRFWGCGREKKEYQVGFCSKPTIKASLGGDKKNKTPKGTGVSGPLTLSHRGVLKEEKELLINS